MPHDAYAEFDHTVLEMIEHSPVGAVPHTMTHQDALKRLMAMKQVYVHADHKNGYVTARSLASQPSFHAENLDALLAGRISADALETNALIFDRYAASVPAAHRARAEGQRLTVAGRPAHHRAKHKGEVIHDPMHTLFFVPGAGVHPGLPGNYLYGFVHEMGSGAWAVHVHDSDDGAMSFDALSMNEALEKMQELVASAPFHLSELEALGFGAV